MPPMSTMPWIELAPDMSGVCRVAGTLLMTSKPTQDGQHEDDERAEQADLAVHAGAALRRREQLGRGGMHDLAVVRDDRAGGDLVVEVEVPSPRP